MKRKITLLILLLTITLLLSGCVPGDGRNTPHHPAGFLMGVWHGWIAPFSLVFGLFKKGIRVYETANKGWWYDLGFYIAIISGFGGLSLTRKKKSSKDDK